MKILYKYVHIYIYVYIYMDIDIYIVQGGKAGEQTSCANGQTASYRDHRSEGNAIPLVGNSEGMNHNRQQLLLDKVGVKD